MVCAFMNVKSLKEKEFAKAWFSWDCCYIGLLPIDTFTFKRTCIYLKMGFPLT